MKMFGVFMTVPAPKGEPGDLSAAEYAAKIAESDKDPLSLHRYRADADETVKKFTSGQFEVREVEVTGMEVVVRREVKL